MRLRLAEIHLGAGLGFVVAAVFHHDASWLLAAILTVLLGLGWLWLSDEDADTP